ncbi:MAG: hypothetical protein ACO3M5_03870 [Saprospiraceae bacterium]|jgi:hypothetical protein
MGKYEIPEIQIEIVEILSDAWKPLKQFTIHYERKGRKPEKQAHEILSNFYLKIRK